MNFFSKNVKFLRESSRLKQSQLKDLMGFKQSAWNNYETGASVPKLLDFIKIAEYFKVSEYDLIHVDMAGRMFSDVRDPGTEYSRACKECEHKEALLDSKEREIGILHELIFALKQTKQLMEQRLKEQEGIGPEKEHPDPERDENRQA
jgi:transcriptional regulator with XRE-family HTH domain